MEDINYSYHILLNMTQKVTSSLSNEKILDLILEEVVSVIPPADNGCLYLFDKTKNKLLSKTSVGHFDNNSVVQLELNPGEGITGRVFVSGNPLIINSTEEVKEKLANLSKYNLDLYINKASLGRYPIGTIAVPLKYQDEIIGVITLDNICSSVIFTDDDLNLLQAAADIAAVSIVQSNMIQREKKHLEELKKINVELEKGHYLLQQTLSIHNKLNNCVLENKSLSDVVRFLHDMTGYPIVIYNPYLKPIASSDNALSKEFPGCITDIIENLLVNNRMKIVPTSNMNEMVHIFPIIGAKKLLGLLCVWVNKKELKEIDLVAFNYSVMVLALQWLKQDAIFEATQKLKGEFFQEALTGNLDEEMLSQSNNLGFDPGDDFCVIITELTNIDKKSIFNENIKKDYYITSLINWFEIKKIKSIIVNEKNYFCILIALKKSDSSRSNDEIIDNFTRDVFLIDPQVIISVGQIYNGIVNIRKSYQEAKQSLNIMKKYYPKSKMVHYGEFGIIHLILNQKEEDVKEYIWKTLGPIIKYDNKKNGELLKTLLKYVKYGKSLHSMAREMHLHINTISYRLKKAEELLAVDFSDVNHWHNIQTACIIYELITPELTER